MHWYLYLIGIVLIAYGCCAILYSFEVRQGVKFLIDTVDKRILAAVPAVVGLLLIISASWSNHAWLLGVLGLLAVIKGALIFLNPGNLWHKISNWYIENIDDKTHRLVGIIAVILGTAVISWI
jgi:uncharacterized protein YjeT (DUF2065 family)